MTLHFAKDTHMAKSLVDDGLWAIIEPLLPRRTPFLKCTKPRTRDRICLTGIIFVLKTGIRWEDFPQEMGCCGMTLWSRLAEWQQTGAWNRIQQVLLSKLKNADLIDWSRAVVDKGTIKAVGATKDPALRRGPKTNTSRLRQLRRMRYRYDSRAAPPEVV